MSKPNPNTDLLHGIRPLDTRSEHRGNLSRRDKIRASIAVAVLAGAGIVGLSHIDSNTELHARQVNTEAQKAVEAGNGNVQRSMLVLSEGVKLRTEPARYADGDRGEESVNNVADTVEKGQALVVDQPVRWTDTDGEVWAGFTFDKGDDGKEWRWVNISALEGEEERGRSDLVTNFRYDGVLDAVNYQANLADGEIVRVTDQASGIDIATGFAMEADEAVHYAQTQTGDSSGE